MVNKSSNEVQLPRETREDKIKKLSIFLSSLDINEEAKLTHIHNAIGIHVNSAKDLLYMYKTFREMPNILVIMDKKGNIIRIVRVEEEDNDLHFKKEIRDCLSNLNNKIDSLNLEIKKIKSKQ